MSVRGEFVVFSGCLVYLDFISFIFLLITCCCRLAALLCECEASCGCNSGIESVVANGKNTNHLLLNLYHEPSRKRDLQSLGPSSSAQRPPAHHQLVYECDADMLRATTKLGVPICRGAEETNCRSEELSS